MTVAAGWDRFLVEVACGLLCAALVLGLAGKRAHSPASPVCVQDGRTVPCLTPQRPRYVLPTSRLVIKAGAICTIQDKRDAPCIVREAAMRAFAKKDGAGWGGI
jgi:hypothetical protein